MTRPLLVVEIDIPKCVHTYGVAPCTAALGVTGDVKCFNSSRTCQDKANFSPSPFTLRFCEPFEELSFAAYPALVSVAVTPNVIDPGRSMGQRASVSIAVDDFQSADSGGLDNYLTDRDYDPFNQGTFWGKLRARIPSMEGFPCRVLRGYIADDGSVDLSTFRVEYYVVTAASMDAKGIAITAKDPLAFCDTKKAQAPAISGGRLAAAITDASTSFSLTPAGIGNLEYPASGKLCLSGKEIVTFTRSGDTITLTSRGNTSGTEQTDHKEDSIAQLVLDYDAQGADDIISDLLLTYTPGIDPAWLDLDEWQTEIDTYVGVLYTASIAAPQSVATLINEVIAQAGLAMWWDVEGQKLRLQALRPVSPGSFTYDDDLIEAGSMAVKEQPDRRVSQAWTYYGVANATNKTDKESNFQAAIASVGTDTELDYELPAIQKTLSRWIPVTARNAAERLNDMLLARFQDAPRLLQFAMHADLPEVPKLGTGIYVAASVFQDATGARVSIPAFVTSVQPDTDSVTIRAEEFNFYDSSVPGANRTIFIEVDTFNVDLRTLYDTLYSGVPDGMILDVYITSTAYVGSINPAYPAFVVSDDWPVDSVIRIFIAEGGGVMGAGGNGSGYQPGFEEGGLGGTAFVIERPVEITNNGMVGGGGGGGGRVIGYGISGGFFVSAGGGGGAGFRRKELVNGVLTRLGGYGGAYGGTSGVAPPDASSGQYGGNGGVGSVDGGQIRAGEGGYLGFSGDTPSAPAGYSASSGGAGGAAVQGESFVTWNLLGNTFGVRTG